MKYLYLFLLFACAVVSYKTTFAFMSSTARSLNNTFASSSSFPTTSPPPPTSTPTPPLISPGDVVINEINWTGSTKGNSDVWVELRNMTNHGISLSSWAIENLGSSTYPTIVLPTTASLSANGYFLIANYVETNPSSVLKVHPDFVTAAISLTTASGELLKLKTSSTSGTTIDSAGGTGKWFFPASSAIKASMERTMVPADGTKNTSWYQATTAANLKSGVLDLGTPRAPND